MFIVCVLLWFFHYYLFACPLLLNVIFITIYINIHRYLFLEVIIYTNGKCKNVCEISPASVLNNANEYIK